ncbi:hypothetical protein DFJ73DRAFT_797532 [Zopfochytrium polystomum]|nr:hypothetical protein DFJ73DRAFT_797532 [Zopfochytrium polystomum]
MTGAQPPASSSAPTQRRPLVPSAAAVSRPTAPTSSISAVSTVLAVGAIGSTENQAGLELTRPNIPVAGGMIRRTASSESGGAGGPSSQALKANGKGNVSVVKGGPGGYAPRRQGTAVEASQRPGADEKPGQDERGSGGGAAPVAPRLGPTEFAGSVCSRAGLQCLPPPVEQAARRMIGAQPAVGSLAVAVAAASTTAARAAGVGRHRCHRRCHRRPLHLLVFTLLLLLLPTTTTLAATDAVPEPHVEYVPLNDPTPPGPHPAKAAAKGAGNALPGAAVQTLLNPHGAALSAAKAVVVGATSGAATHSLHQAGRWAAEKLRGSNVPGAQALANMMPGKPVSKDPRERFKRAIRKGAIFGAAVGSAFGGPIGAAYGAVNGGIGGAANQAVLELTTNQGINKPKSSAGHVQMTDATSWGHAKSNKQQQPGKTGKGVASLPSYFQDVIKQHGGVDACTIKRRDEVMMVRRAPSRGGGSGGCNLAKVGSAKGGGAAGGAGKGKKGGGIGAKGSAGGGGGKMMAARKLLLLHKLPMPGAQPGSAAVPLAAAGRNRRLLGDRAAAPVVTAADYDDGDHDDASANTPPRHTHRRRLSTVPILRSLLLLLLLLLLLPTTIALASTDPQPSEPHVEYVPLNDPNPPGPRPAKSAAKGAQNALPGAAVQSLLNPHAAALSAAKAVAVGATSGAVMDAGRWAAQRIRESNVPGRHAIANMMPGKPVSKDPKERFKSAMKRGAFLGAMVGGGFAGPIGAAKGAINGAIGGAANQAVLELTTNQGINKPKSSAGHVEMSDATSWGHKKTNKQQPGKTGKGGGVASLPSYFHDVIKQHGGVDACTLKRRDGLVRRAPARGGGGCGAKAGTGAQGRAGGGAGATSARAKASGKEAKGSGAGGGGGGAGRKPAGKKA